MFGIGPCSTEAIPSGRIVPRWQQPSQGGWQGIHRLSDQSGAGEVRTSIDRQRNRNWQIPDAENAARYNLADAYVMASFGEIRHVLIEAAASGVPLARRWVE